MLNQDHAHQRRLEGLLEHIGLKKGRMFVCVSELES
jgi:hypothetical protein